MLGPGIGVGQGVIVGRRVGGGTGVMDARTVIDAGNALAGSLVLVAISIASEAVLDHTKSPVTNKHIAIFAIQTPVTSWFRRLLFIKA